VGHDRRETKVMVRLRNSPQTQLLGIGGERSLTPQSLAVIGPDDLVLFIGQLHEGECPDTSFPDGGRYEHCSSCLGEAP
jgi:hypothetical protein